MVRLYLVCLLMIGWWGMLQGQIVTLHGQHESYANIPVHVTIAWNPFITIPEYSKIVHCDEQGAFTDTFEINTGRVVQIEAGINESYLFVEPGHHYEIALPEYREVSYSDRISPYFQPQVLPADLRWRKDLSTGTITDGSRDVNRAIARFDSLYAECNREVINARRLNQIVDSDSLISQLESVFAGDSSAFFSEYRRCRYGILKLNEGRTPLAVISHDFLGPVVKESNPGFTELFRALFSDFFFHYSQTPPGRNLRTHINRTHRLDSIRSTIRMHNAVWSDTLADMIILQEMISLFYSGNYHKEAILILLDSLANDPVSGRFGTYAVQIRNKLSSLMIGNAPPSFSLKDQEGNSWSPDLAGDRYLYLMFCSPDLYGCMVEYPFLESYHQRHAEYLEVVTVMLADKEQDVKQFMDQNGYKWKALYYTDQPYLLDDYMIRAFPTAYLVGPDGTLILSPATLPSEGFEQQLFRIMRSRGEI